MLKNWREFSVINNQIIVFNVVLDEILINQNFKYWDSFESFKREEGIDDNITDMLDSRDYVGDLLCLKDTFINDKNGEFKNYYLILFSQRMLLISYNCSGDYKITNLYLKPEHFTLDITVLDYHISRAFSYNISQMPNTLGRI